MRTKNDLVVHPRPVDGEQPPFDSEAEAAILGVLLIEDDGLYRYPQLRAEHFYEGRHRTIFEAVEALTKAGTPPDIVNVATHLRDRARLEQVGGMGYLHELIENSVTRLAAQSYVATVIEKARLRDLIVACQKTIARAYLDKEVPALDITNALSRDLLHITSDHQELVLQKHGQMRHSLNGLATRANEWAVRDRQKVEHPFFQTGIIELDRVLRNIKPKKLTVLAGRPGHGKSAFALNHIVYPWTKQPNEHACFIGLEMDNNETYMRNVAYAADVNQKHLAEPWLLTEREWASITAFCGDNERSNRNIHFIFKSILNIFELKAIVRQIAMQAEHEGGRLSLVAIDYLQLLKFTSDDARASRYELIGNAVEELKHLAGEMNIAVVLLSALSRANESRTGTDRRPKSTDLAESGKIEAHADNVIILYRPHIDSEDMEKRNLVEIIVTKQRAGDTGLITACFDGSHARFKDRDFTSSKAEAYWTSVPKSHRDRAYKDD